MSKRAFTNLVAALLLVSFIVPTAFFAAPRRASAADASCAIGTLAGIAFSKVWASTTAVPSGDVPSGTATFTTAGSTVAQCIYDTVLVPILRGIIRSFLQQMTQSTVAWINGTGAPGGQPSFVPNLSVHLQGVGDAAALAFLNQVSAGFQSPFDITIAASLRNQYLQQTSVAGFFSQFKSTLSQYSPNVNSFLAGDWSQGGVSAWLALTTQPQNNPYLLYQAAARQLATQVTDAQENRRQDLLQSGGFLSFCPPSSTSGASAVNPSAQCTDPNTGKPVNATTPGSVIMSYLQANVNSGVGQLVSAQDLDSALLTVVQALANKVLSSTGLFSVSTSPTSRIFGGGGTGGGGTGGGGGGGGGGGTSTGAANLAQTVLTNVEAYQTAWNSVQSAATAAQTSLTTMRNSCTAELSAGTIGTVAITTADEQAAYQAMNPFIQQAQSALAQASTTAAFAERVLAEASSPSTDPAQLSADITAMMAMPPSAADVALAETNAQATGAARAAPTGSVTVSGGSMLDQANLVAANANALAPQCAGYSATGTGTTALNGGQLPNLYGSATTGQLIRYATPGANQPVCFSAALNQQDVNVDRMFFLTTDSSMYTAGNVTYWISNAFNGQPMTGAACSSLGQTLSSCTMTAPFTFTKTMDFYAPSAGTYYWCIKLDTAGNKVGAELWPGVDQTALGSGG